MLDTITLADWIGSVGVALLLCAFALNLSGNLLRDSFSYTAMNMIGAGLAASASWMINYLPFVILEGVWCFVSAIALGRVVARSVKTVDQERGHAT